MNEQYEYLTVPEFAERAGVSKQAVYSRIKSGGIDEYIAEEGGKKRISTAALPFFTPRQEESKVDNQNQSTLQNELNQFDNQNQSNSDKLIVELMEQVKGLNAQVEMLIRQIEEKDAKLIEYADKFAELAEKALNTTGQAQLLHAHAVAEDEPKPVIADPVSVDTSEQTGQSTKVNLKTRIVNFFQSKIVK